MQIYSSLKALHAIDLFCMSSYQQTYGVTAHCLSDAYACLLPQHENNKISIYLTDFFRIVPHIRHPLHANVFAQVDTVEKQLTLWEQMHRFDVEKCTPDEEEARMYYYGGSPSDENHYKIYRPIMQMFWQRELLARVGNTDYRYYFFNNGQQIIVRLFGTTPERKFTYLGETAYDWVLFEAALDESVVRSWNEMEANMQQLAHFDINTHQQAATLKVLPIDMNQIYSDYNDLRDKYSLTKLQQIIAHDDAGWLWLIKEAI